MNQSTLNMDVIGELATGKLDKALMDKYWTYKIQVDAGEGVVGFDRDWIYIKTKGKQVKEPREALDETVKKNLARLRG